MVMTFKVKCADALVNILWFVLKESNMHTFSMHVTVTLKMASIRIKPFTVQFETWK